MEYVVNIIPCWWVHRGLYWWLIGDYVWTFTNQPVESNGIRVLFMVHMYMAVSEMRHSLKIARAFRQSSINLINHFDFWVMWVNQQYTIPHITIFIGAINHSQSWVVYCMILFYLHYHIFTQTHVMMYCWLLYCPLWIHYLSIQYQLNPHDLPIKSPLNHH